MAYFPNGASLEQFERDVCAAACIGQPPRRSVP